jgi:phage/plasmid-like protein (TIGR03299 family)
MAHNLTQTNGRAEMAYVGDTPWHGLGTRLERVATSAEMIVAAGLDWEVEKAPLYVDAPGGPREVPGHVGIRRLDTLEVLGVLTKQFRPIQNAEAFQILDDIAGTSGAMYHTAGSIKGGKQVWALIKLPGNLVVGPDDVVNQYLALMNAHDGTMALSIRFTPIRIVCNNTLNLAFNVDAEGRQSRSADATRRR